MTHVIDGDTIGVGRGWRYQRVRLIGVDTPKTVHPEKPVEAFGPEAAAFTTHQLQSQWIHLEFEVGNLRDRYRVPRIMAVKAELAKPYRDQAAAARTFMPYTPSAYTVSAGSRPGNA